MQQRKHLIQHLIILLHSASTDCSCSKHLVSLEGGDHACFLYLPTLLQRSIFSFQLELSDVWDRYKQEREGTPQGVADTLLHTSDSAD